MIHHVVVLIIWGLPVNFHSKSNPLNQTCHTFPKMSPNFLLLSKYHNGLPWWQKDGKKNLPAMWEIGVRSLGWEDPLEKEMATDSNILGCRIPWTEEPGGLPSMGSQRVRHNWVTKTQIPVIAVNLWYSFPVVKSTASTTMSCMCKFSKPNSKISLFSP